METGSKGATALTGQTTTLGKEALTGKLTMLYSHTLLFILIVSEDSPAPRRSADQSTTPRNFGLMHSASGSTMAWHLAAIVSLPPCLTACVSVVS